MNRSEGELARKKDEATRRLGGGTEHTHTHTHTHTHIHVAYAVCMFNIFLRVKVCATSKDVHSLISTRLNTTKHDNWQEQKLGRQTTAPQNESPTPLKCL